MRHRASSLSHQKRLGFMSCVIEHHQGKSLTRVMKPSLWHPARCLEGCIIVAYNPVHLLRHTAPNASLHHLRHTTLLHHTTLCICLPVLPSCQLSSTHTSHHPHTHRPLHDAAILPGGGEGTRGRRAGGSLNGRHYRLCHHRQHLVVAVTEFSV